MAAARLLSRLGFHQFLQAGDGAAAGAREAAAPSVESILRERQLRAVFQPILDYRAHGYFGYEGLIRGPVGAFESPLALLDAARDPAARLALDQACWETIVAAFGGQHLPGYLFLNVSPSSLLHPSMRNGETRERLRRLGVDATRIIIELTENQAISDFSEIRDAAADYRKMGFRIAIDDLGEGFSNLRMWSEVRPDFVKIDRHFVQGIADDVLKFHLVSAMHELAEVSGASIIAEGIESEADFLTVRDLGIACGQGFLIARPTPEPERRPSAETLAMLGRRELIVFPSAQKSLPRQNVRSLLRCVTPIHPDVDNAHAYACFESDPELHVLPVVDADGIPRGMINRMSLIDRFARPYRRELYGRKPCTQFMDAAPLLVDHSVSIQELGRMVSRSARHHLFDGFIITEQGRYLGVGSSQDLMALITEMQISAARYANPLTQLPGNVPLDEHMERLIESGVEFTASYFDIDHFKSYNDQYGYRRGDEIIEMVGGLVREIADPRLDFVAHIGGDDFMLLFQSDDWEARCARALRLFDERIARHVSAEHRAAGGYLGEDRKGRSVFHPLPCLSIGALRVEANEYETHHQVAAATSAAKRMAKRQAGSSLFIERRRPAAPALAATAD